MPTLQRRMLRRRKRPAHPPHHRRTSTRRMISSKSRDQFSAPNSPWLDQPSTSALTRQGSPHRSSRGRRRHRTIGVLHRMSLSLASTWGTRASPRTIRSCMASRVRWATPTSLWRHCHCCRSRAWDPAPSRGQCHPRQPGKAARL